MKCPVEAWQNTFSESGLKVHPLYHLAGIQALGLGRLVLMLKNTAMALSGSVIVTVSPKTDLNDLSSTVAWNHYIGPESLGLKTTFLMNSLGFKLFSLNATSFYVASINVWYEVGSLMMPSKLSLTETQKPDIVRRSR